MLPKAKCNRHGIDIEFIPPRTFVTDTVEFPVVDAAQRNREFIRDSTAKRTRLRETDVMGLARLPATDRIGLAANKPQVVLIAIAPRLRSGPVSFDSDSQRQRTSGSRLFRGRHWLM